MVKKTRERFIEVARQLFARNGIENTTMNDIASASDKGRRTIYTYFKSKTEIFNAVIASETEQLIHKLMMISVMPATAPQKLESYVRCRLETMREIVRRNGSLRAGFFRDVRKVDRARKIISHREVELMSKILEDGCHEGYFNIEDCKARALMITNAIHGLDVPFIRGSLEDNDMDREKMIKEFSLMILQGVLIR